MAHEAQRVFCREVKQKFPDMFKGKDVLDVGALDVNGNNRWMFDDCTYTGIDLGPGGNVDVVSKGHEYAPGKQYDVVISTECFEHDMHWKETIANCIALTKPGGLFFFTCAYDGRREHGTTKSSVAESPISHIIFNDYYMNLNEKLVIGINGFISSFSVYEFSVNLEVKDLYFYGIKI